MAWGNHTVPVPGAAVERQSPQMPLLPGQIVAPVPEVQEAPIANWGRCRGRWSGLRRRMWIVMYERWRQCPSMWLRRHRCGFDQYAPRATWPRGVNRRAAPGSERSIHSQTGRYQYRPLRSSSAGPAVERGGPAHAGDARFRGKAVVPPPPVMDSVSGAPGGGSGRNARAQTGIGSAGGQIVPPPPSMQGSHSTDALGV